MTYNYCPYHGQFNKHQPNYHPGKENLSEVEDPLTIKLLDIFFQDAFHPNQDNQIPPDNYQQFIENQKNFTKSIEVARPNCKNGEMKILDLASGDLQFLKLLLKNHGSVSCFSEECEKFSSQYAKRVRYMAVDFEFPISYKQSVNELLSQFENCFELIFESLDLTQHYGLNRLNKIKEDMLFDMVILSNALHEISPKTWPELLSIIPDLMDDNGVFILLDLPNPMLLQKYEDINKSILKSNSYWEADAIYCSHKDAIDLVKKMGLEEKACFGLNNDNPYWLIVGRKTTKTPTIEKRRKDISSFLFTFTQNQFLNWENNSLRERNNVKKIFKGTHDIHEHIISALRYLCLCASDTRIHEYIKLQNNKD